MTDKKTVRYAHQSAKRTLAMLEKINNMTNYETKLVLIAIITCELITLEQADLAFDFLDRFKADVSK